jgi:hypothetical protein
MIRGGSLGVYHSVSPPKRTLLRLPPIFLGVNMGDLIDNILRGVFVVIGGLIVLEVFHLIGWF